MYSIAAAISTDSFKWAAQDVKAPFVLLINPWITDFAAYDLWTKPMGLLLLASLLREGGCGVALIDCLDRRDPFTNFHPETMPGRDKKFGTGKYPRMRLPKPRPYNDFPRYFTGTEFTRRAFAVSFWKSKSRT